LVACQPIQPLLPEAEAPSVAGAPSAGAPTTYHTVGITVALPEGWSTWYDPAERIMTAVSADIPAEEQWKVDFWGYLFREPVLAVSFYNERNVAGAMLPPATMLTSHFESTALSEYQINPLPGTAVVETPPVEVAVNGQRAYRAVIGGTDSAFKTAFHAHVWLILDEGGDGVYIACALLPENEAALLPLCEQIVATVVVDPIDRQAAERPLAETGTIAPGAPVEATTPVATRGEVIRHYWRFAGAAGRSYRVTVAPQDEFFDPAAAIKDAAGKNVAGEFDAVGGGGAETFIVRIKEDADYYIMVRPFGMLPGHYTLLLEEIEQ
jgi:hypothetical protein